MLKRLELNCGACGFHTELLVGSTGKDQTYSDVNEDFALYQVFYCPEGKEYLSLDIHDRHFDGKCPVHGSTIERIDTFPAVCPMCNSPLEVTEKSILPTMEAAG